MKTNKKSNKYIKENKSKSKINNDEIFGIDKIYLVVFLVSFSQGIQGLSDLALSYMYKDDLKLQPYEVSRISGIIGLPWIIKPLYGFISDSFPIFGYRRKPYLFIFGFIVSICWILMSFYVDSLSKVLTVAIICSTATCFINVIGEALIVELSQKQSKTDKNSGAKNVSMFFMTKSVGSLITAFSSGALLQYLDKRKSKIKNKK
jgi:Na+/melibiose symporter-like transporter